MGRFADIGDEVAARLAAGRAMESIGLLAEVEPDEAARVLTEADLEFYGALLEDADRSVARRDGADMRSELAMRARALREQSARLDRKAERIDGPPEASERAAAASRSLSGLADAVDDLAARRWTRKGRGA